MEALKNCTGFGEFILRNCLEQPVILTHGVFNPRHMAIHRYPVEERKIPLPLRMQLSQCHDSDRLEITE